MEFAHCMVYGVWQSVLFAIIFFQRAFFVSYASTAYRLLATFLVTKSHNLWNNDQKLYTNHYTIIMGSFYAMHVFFSVVNLLMLVRVIVDNIVVDMPRNIVWNVCMWV